jgi:hypothetical protein
MTDTSDVVVTATQTLQAGDRCRLSGGRGYATIKEDELGNAHLEHDTSSEWFPLHDGFDFVSRDELNQFWLEFCSVMEFHPARYPVPGTIVESAKAYGAFHQVAYEYLPVQHGNSDRDRRGVMYFALFKQPYAG